MTTTDEQTEIERLKQQVSYLQGHNIKISQELVDARAVSQSRLLHIKHQRAVLDAVVSALTAAGLSVSPHGISRVINDYVSQDDDSCATVGLRRYKEEPEREVFIGQGFLQ